MALERAELLQFVPDAIDMALKLFRMQADHTDLCRPALRLRAGFDRQEGDQQQRESEAKFYGHTRPQVFLVVCC